jgi:hypothetical protein
VGDNSERAADLIKELLILNRGEGAPTLGTLTAIEAEGRKSRRMRVRQDLVQVLDHRDGKN